MSTIITVGCVVLGIGLFSAICTAAAIFGNINRLSDDEVYPDYFPDVEEE